MQMSSPKAGKDQTEIRLALMQAVANIRRCTAQLDEGDPVMTKAIFEEIRDYAARASSLVLPAGGTDVEGGWGTKAALEVQPGGAHEASVGSPSSVDQMSDASVGKRKLPLTGDGRRRIGCRRRSQQYAAGIRRVESKNLEDGHAWRKYGQKDIQTSKFPRSYFRCTHKYTQGCKAQRQVQKSESEASTFIITYIGEHTCTVDPAAAPAVSHGIMSPLNSKGSYLISFGAATTNCSETIQITAPSLKMERDDELSNLTTGSSSSNYHVLQESAPPVAGITPVAADAGSVFHSPSTSCVPMEFGTETDIEFADLQDLDVCEFFLAV